MKPRFVSAMAVLFCCAILLFVCLFGYSRYKAAQTANEAFRAQLVRNAQDQQGGIAAHMPEEIPPRANSADGEAPASPDQGQK
jgi:hypothetical protein